MNEENYDKIDLHKNIVDQIVLVSDSGKPMKRENPTLLMFGLTVDPCPMHNGTIPLKIKTLLISGQTFPADFIAEGVDQTRGWFYTLHAIATMVFDSQWLIKM